MIYPIKERITRRYLALLFYVFSLTLVGCQFGDKKSTSNAGDSQQEQSQQSEDIEGEGGEDDGEENKLAFNDLELLTLENVDFYQVEGRCLSTLGPVTIAVEHPHVEQVVDCKVGDTFSGIFDLRRITSTPLIIAATQGSKIITDSSVENNIQHFISEWNFDQEDYLFVFPIKENLNYNFIIDWGDGSYQDEVTSFDDSDKTHTYTETGNYTITVMGLCEGFENALGDEVGKRFSSPCKSFKFRSCGLE